jgi:RimJ/RimL family protein N-acetyltransferase
MRSIDGGIAGFGRAMLARCGIRTARLPRRMAGTKVSLRWYRYADLGRLRRCMPAELLRQTNGAVCHGIPGFGTFCYWMLTTFPLAYVIQLRDHGRPRDAGFVGVYDITLGHDLWVAVAIFQPRDRQQGYGQEACRLLLDSLTRHRVVSHVYADVLSTNVPSLRFFARLGFVPAREGPTYHRLVKPIG